MELGAQQARRTTLPYRDSFRVLDAAWGLHLGGALDHTAMVAMEGSPGLWLGTRSLQAPGPGEAFRQGGRHNPRFAVWTSLNLRQVVSCLH